MVDVDETRSAANFAKFPKATKYKDFRVMLEKEGKNVDACTIGIPDHMHATVALACMQNGKSVYVEKPLTRTPWEARLLADAAVKYKVATQMGNQGYSHEGIRTASEILWSGEIGEVREVHVCSTPGTHPTGLSQPPKESSVPSNLNYDLWLGGAAMRAYAVEYTPYNWRGFFDFGTGQIGNWGIHSMGPVNMALQLGAPTSVEMIKVVNSSKLTFPDRAILKFEFPARGGMPPVTVYWHDSAKPSDPEAYHVPRHGERNGPPRHGEPRRERPRTSPSASRLPPQAHQPERAPLGRRRPWRHRLRTAPRSSQARHPHGQRRRLRRLQRTHGHHRTR